MMRPTLDAVATLGARVRIGISRGASADCMTVAAGAKPLPPISSLGASWLDGEAGGADAVAVTTDAPPGQAGRLLRCQAQPPSHAWMPLLASCLLVTAAAVGSVGGFIAGSFMGNAFTLPADAPNWHALEAAYNASVLAAAKGGLEWPDGQVLFADAPPLVCWSVGRRGAEYGTDCTPNTGKDAPLGVLPGGGCASTGVCWVSAHRVSCM